MKTWLIIGCGRKKARSSARAQDLYTGSLTQARIDYAQRSGQPWLILSAKHLILAPEVHIAPYDLTLANLDATELAQWRSEVVAQICAFCLAGEDPREVTLELHAGLEYRAVITPMLELLGFKVTAPTAHLGMIGQLNFYRAARLQEAA